MAIQDTEKEHRTYNEMPTEGRYPLQQVMQMEGGHRIIVSNDPQSPYVAFFHTSGSHTIYRPDGSLDNFTVGNSRSYNKSGASVTVDNNNDMHIAGHQKIHVEGGGHIEISGDANIVAGGKINAIALAGMGISAKGNIYFGAEQGISLNAPSGLTISDNQVIQQLVLQLLLLVYCR